ncbi:hypothetical protein C9374_010372 [Naegleria lovaniensis]|uniref:Uncharacterized protein n=1 Tax=Naegleria lovaniensis TaxID=51637 RepID=A0AA88GHK4_NAELO|nr:uncharacterized protein C9374_010372 [Naegleria lovaniensis]KAG2374998.1 hypothetical protein C9374_010372 [Naegleria lovaniensis]
MSYYIHHDDEGEFRSFKAIPIMTSNACIHHTDYFPHSSTTLRKDWLTRLSRPTCQRQQYYSISESLSSSSSESSPRLHGTVENQLESLLPNDPLVKYALDQNKELFKRKLERTKHKYQSKKKHYEHEFQKQLCESVRENNLLHASLCAQNDATRDVQAENAILRQRLTQLELQNMTLLKKHQEMKQEKELAEMWCERWHDRSRTLSKLILSFNTILNQQHESSCGDKYANEMSKLLLDESKVNIVGSARTEISDFNSKSDSSLAGLHLKLLNEMLQDEHEKWMPPFKSKRKKQEESEMVRQYQTTIQQLEEKIVKLEESLQQAVKKEKSVVHGMACKERMISELKMLLEQSEKTRWDREETILRLENEKSMCVPIRRMKSRVNCSQQTSPTECRHVSDSIETSKVNDDES